MTTLTRKSPREFGQEVERLQDEGRWTLDEYRRLRQQVLEQYGPNSGLLDALAADADPAWRDEVLVES